MRENRRHTAIHLDQLRLVCESPLANLRSEANLISTNCSQNFSNDQQITQCQRDDSSFELSLLRFCLPVASLHMCLSVGKP